jgi:hypothetical protein
MEENIRDFLGFIYIYMLRENGRKKDIDGHS